MEKQAKIEDNIQNKSFSGDDYEPIEYIKKRDGHFNNNYGWIIIVTLRS